MLIVTRKKPTYESGISKDGKALVLFPASKSVFERITDSENRVRDRNTKEQLNELYRLLSMILSENTEGVPVTEEEVNDIDPMTASEIINEYMSFMKGIRTNPN